MHLQPYLTLEINDQEEIDNLDLPACLVLNNPPSFTIKHANILFINLLKKKKQSITGLALNDVFPKSLEFKYYPHQNSLKEGLRKAGSTKNKIHISSEHYVLSVNNDEVFEINKWALSIKPVLRDGDDIVFLLVTVLEQ